MYEVLQDIIDAVRSNGPLDDLQLGQILNAHNKRVGGPKRAYSKKRVLPFYLKLKEEDSAAWEALNLDGKLERELFQTLRMKPRRTASGVATITVITKPYPCSGNCLYCPNDIRMPKSYLHREPACQRAERNYFDPYLQVSSRLRALAQMGHACDKIELIILGGSWTDYSLAYQTWFMKELFCALNDGGVEVEANVKARKELYRSCGIDARDEVLEQQTSSFQERIDAGDTTYNEVVAKLYGEDSPWAQAATWQEASFEELFEQQKANEQATHRVVGLVVETRPEAITIKSLEELRLFGCTKIQIGVQSLREDVLRLNDRFTSLETMKSAFELLRAFGFKLHTHFMANLHGSSIEEDEADYLRFMTDRAFQPDEVKMYPCVLVEGTGLVEKHRSGAWKPYEEDQLIELLAHNMLATPAFTRVSRMIRDISAEDIVAGSKKTNLRQLVERTPDFIDGTIKEIRSREIAGDEIDFDELELDEIVYETSNTVERFLQWVTPEDKIAGFLRLSFPDKDYIETKRSELPPELGCAMIREVHVYGQVANLHKADGSAQHQGLGRQLIERACEVSREAGYDRINVISSVGTREYYRKLGFLDGALYQTRAL